MIFLVLLGGVAGCASHKSTMPALAPRYYGTWKNVDPRYFNWWQIDAHGVINYGTGFDAGKCTANSVSIIAPNQIDVNFGNTGRAILRTVEGGDLLLFQGDRGLALHKRVDVADICRKSDGTYFDGAPSKP